MSARASGCAARCPARLRVMRPRWRTPDHAARPTCAPHTTTHSDVGRSPQPTPSTRGPRASRSGGKRGRPMSHCGRSALSAPSGFRIHQSPSSFDVHITYRRRRPRRPSWRRGSRSQTWWPRRGVCGCPSNALLLLLRARSVEEYSAFPSASTGPAKESLTDSNRTLIVCCRRAPVRVEGTHWSDGVVFASVMQCA